MGKRRNGNGEGSVYRDGKRWVAAVTLAMTPEGKPIRVKRYATTKKEANQKRDELIQLREAESRLLTERQTVREYFNYWLDDVKGPHVSPTTVRNYRSLLEFHIYPAIGHMVLASVEPRHIQEAINRITSNGKASTARHVLIILRMAFESAKQWGLTTQNAAKVIAAPKSRTAERLALTPAQSWQLLQAASGRDDEGVYWMALLMGMRQGEILGLQWGDVNLETGEVNIRRTLQDTHEGQPIYSHPKTEAGRRVVYLPPPVIEVLRVQQHRQAAWQKALQIRMRVWLSHDLVFTMPSGAPISGESIRDRFRVLLKETGLPPIHFHDTRHACQSLLAELGVTERTSMDLLGHRDVKTTRMVYTHSSEAGKRRAAQQIGEVFDGLRKAV